MTGGRIVRASPVAPPVVIASRNRVGTLLRTLDRLLALPERPRVAVVDNASSDGTARLVRRLHPAVTVLRLDENVGAAARTAGVELFDAPFVAFSDDDSWWAPGSLVRAREVLEDHARVAVVAARILVGEHGGLDPTCALMERSPLPCDPGFPGRRVLGFLACGAVVRREAFLTAGGFGTRLRYRGEERLLAVDLARMGWHVAYVPEIVAHHAPAPRVSSGPGCPRELEVRNAIWFAWLRRPLTAAPASTFAGIRSGLADAEALRGTLRAVAGLPVVLRERALLPHEVEVELRMLERQANSGRRGRRL